MGKESRRANRRNRHDGNRTSDAAQDTNSLSVTIGVTPSGASGQRISLSEELRLVRSTLLYADHVNLVAPGASMLWTLAPLRGLSPGQSLESLLKLPSVTLGRMFEPNVPMRQFCRQLKRIASLPSQHPDRQEAEMALRPALKNSLEVVNQQMGPDSPELDMALESDSVTLIGEGFSLDQSTDEQISWFKAKVSEALSDPSGALLLDKPANSLMNMNNEVPWSKVAQKRSRRTATGARFLENLPAFPNAPMEQVLEAREELADDRASYRSSIRRVANELESNADDPMLIGEIDELWRDEVRPQLVTMKKHAQATRVFRETAKSLTFDRVGPTTISLAFSGVGQLLSLLPTTLGLGVAGTGVALEGTKQALDARAEQRSHQFAYLLDANKKLGDFGLE